MKMIRLNSIRLVPTNKDSTDAEKVFAQHINLFLLNTLILSAVHGFNPREFMMKVALEVFEAAEEYEKSTDAEAQPVANTDQTGHA